MQPFNHISHSLKKIGSPPITTEQKIQQQISTTTTKIEHLTCTECNETKTIYHFHKRRQSSSGYRRECNSCRSSHRRFLRENEGKREELQKEQNNACAICGRVDEANGKSLALDHDHKTKTIRGLLCMRCNTGIALLNEEPEVLNNAAQYLRNHATPTPMSEM
jgi:hypothetical protein